MRRSVVRAVWPLAIPVLAAACGCQGTSLRVLNLIGVRREPLVVTLVAEHPAEAVLVPLAELNPFGPYRKLESALADKLGRPIGLDLCFPFQVAPALSSGLYHIAVLSPIEYARLPQPERFAVIAVPVYEHGATAWPAVLVVAAGSPIKSITDLRGKVVAFGPAAAARTNEAGLQLLARHGLRKTDLSLELLPIPGSLKHMPNMPAVARTVINRSSDAGFIDQAAWNELPEHAARDENPARDRLTVLGETVALPERLLVASPKLDTATVERIRAALLAVQREHPEALQPLGIAGYAPPSDELLAACRSLTQAEPAAEAPPVSAPAE